MTMMSDLGRIALPIGSPGQPTMQDLSETIRRDPEVSATRKRDICSAIRTLCAAFGEAPADVPASHAYFRRRLKDFHPKQAGLGEKRFRNIRSDIGFVLRRYLGQSSLAGRRAALSPAWVALRDRLRTDGFRYGLSRFMRFCSTHRVEPDGVDDAVGRHFLACLRDETFVQRPEALHRRTLTLWNKAADTIDGWPQVSLTLPSNRRGYCLPWDRLPDPLRQDAEAWLENLRNPDILGDDAPARPARPATVTARKFQVRQIVSALVLGGQDLDALTSLEALVHPQRVRQVLRFFLARSGGEPTSQTAAIAGTLVAIARHWVRVDARHLGELRNIKRKVTPRQEGLTAKNRSRLRQFDSDHNKALLLGFPQAVLDEVERKSRPQRKDALLMQTALAVELLIMMPLRLKNLVGLSMERHLIRRREPTRERVLIVIPPHEVKNREELAFDLPPESITLLDLYLERYRPLLTKGPSGWLFPGAGPDRHKSPDRFTRQIRKTVFKWTGLIVNTHLFRHIDAKLYLDEKPGGYEVVRRVLAHRRMETTTRHYTGLEAAAAARHFDQVILRLRGRLCGGSTDAGA